MYSNVSGATIALTDVLVPFNLQVRNLTSALGRAVSGDSPAPTNWPVTTANTQAPSRSSASTANAVSPAPTTWPSTSNATNEDDAAPFFFLYIYILLLFPLDYLVIFLFIHCRWSHIEQNDGNKKPKWAKRSNLWQWWRKKRKKTHFSSFEKKRKPFPPQVFWHELVADVVFNLLGVRKSFDVVAPLTTFVIKEIQHLRVPKLWLWFHSWFVLCTQPRLPRLRPFFLYSGFKGEKNSQSLYDLQSFGQVWSTKFVCSPPTTTMPTKNWMSKHIPIFFFNIFRFLVKKKIENPVWAGKWLNLTKKLSCILEPKFSTQCILLSSCKIKWILTIFILKKKQRKKK